MTTWHIEHRFEIGIVHWASKGDVNEASKRLDKPARQIWAHRNSHFPCLQDALSTTYLVGRVSQPTILVSDVFIALKDLELCRHLRALDPASFFQEYSQLVSHM